jgi:predicted RecA/RadA family phage recombinase
MKNYVQSGEIITVTAPADCKSGDPVAVGSIFGVACRQADKDRRHGIETAGGLRGRGDRARVIDLPA